jgi:hypothetical protein
MLAISLRPGIARNPNHILARTFLGFENMKKANILVKMREEASKWPK